MLAFTCHVFLLANNPFAVQAHNSNFTVSYCTGNMSQRGGAAGGPKVKRVMTQAINLIFEFLKNVSLNVNYTLPFLCNKSLDYVLQKERVQIWLFENVSMKMEGVIIVSFCSFMSFWLIALVV